LLCAISAVGCGAGPREWSVSSPANNIRVTVLRESVGGTFPQNDLSYTVTLNGKVILPKSPLGVTMVGTDGDFVRGLRFVGQETREINETYPMPSGKKSLQVNHCKELQLSFKNSEGRRMDVDFRAYDDGMAYRYSFPGKGETRVITGEASGFTIPLGSNSWVMPWQKDYEGFHHRQIVGWRNFYDEADAFPALFQTPAGQWVLLTEAAVYGDYCGSRLAGRYRVNGIYQIMLDPNPGTVTWTLPWNTPWRVAMIGETLGPIVESTLVDNLNPPNEIGDLSWIKPGRTTWTWWYQDVGAKEDLQPQFAAFGKEMGWEYPTGKEVQGFHFATLLSRSWESIEAELAKREQVGVVGLKMDFQDSDSQTRMQFYDRMAQLCAKHHQMINWHGATIPRGQRRRWPHMVGCEGVRGAEYYKIFNDFPDTVSYDNAPPNPVHNTTLPFTRNVVGPMDFTGVTFSGPASRPRRTTSNAHELAISVMFENGLQYWGDHPNIYRRIPAAMSFLKLVPASWDDIKFIDGYPGVYCALARRKGKDWFLAMLYGQTPTAGDMWWVDKAKDPSSIPYALKFLDPGVEYTLTLHHDGQNKDTIVTETRTVTNQTVLTVPTLEGGGFCGYITERGT
jgi:alpha-glucosidase